MSKLDYCFEQNKSHAIKKRIWYDMLGSIPHQKFCYDLPTRGRVGIKLGDADMSPTYL